MTVIAYDKHTMAADSLIADDHGRKWFNAEKLYRLKSGAVLGMAGDSDWRDMIALLDNAETGADLPSREDLEGLKADLMALVWLPDRKVYAIDIVWIEGKIYHAQVNPTDGGPIAIGHGGEYAQSILDAGGTAEEAVKAAIKRSLFCGGPVKTMALDAKTPRPKKKRVPTIAVPVKEFLGKNFLGLKHSIKWPEKPEVE